MARLEKDLMKSVQQRLTIWKMTGEILNYHRLNSGTIRNMHTGSWVKLGEKDTPDWLALVRNRQDGVTALYIECKSSTGKLTKGQQEFSDKYNRKSGIYVLELRDIKELDKWIDKNAKDFVSLIGNNR